MPRQKGRLHCRGHGTAKMPKTEQTHELGYFELCPIEEAQGVGVGETGANDLDDLPPGHC